jgi:hypothetical protein
MSLFTLPWFNASKGAEAKPMLSDERGMLTQQAGGQHWHASKQRKLFTTNMAAAGAVLPIFSGTTQQFGLFNPLGSGVNVQLVELAMTYVSTTGAAGGYVLALVKNAGAGQATGGNLTSLTALSVWDGISNGNAASGNKAYGITAFGCTAPVIYRHLGLNHQALTAADATQNAWLTKQRFDGDVGIAPGTVLVVAGNIATLSTWAVSATWVEEPV